MKRRSFIRHATRTALIPPMLNGLGIPAFSNSSLLRGLYQDLEETDKVLVLVYLGGGNDGLNTVVPVDQFDNLAKVRPDVILPEGSLLDLDGLESVKFHPSLQGFRSLYDEGKLAILQNVGYPTQNYSHFRSTDIWMTAADSDEVLPTGWLGRYLDHDFPNFPAGYPNATVPDPLAIEIGYNLSVAFQGPVTGMGIVVADPEWFYKLVNDVDDPIPDTIAGDKLGYIRLITKQSQVYGEVIRNAAVKVNQQVSYPDNNPLAEQLAVVSRLIAGGLQTRLYMVSLHGFDTHDNQVVPSNHLLGEHANLLQQLSEAVEAFMKDLDFLDTKERVLGATISEFGRRIISNASSGTDHGAAAPLFVFGEAVNGGLFGTNPVIPFEAGVSDNLEMEFDFRSVYQTILNNWFCVSDSALQSTFGQSFEQIPFIGSSPCLPTSQRELYGSAGLTLIRVSPNPVESILNIELLGHGRNVHIDLFDNSGKHLANISSGPIPEGWQQISWDVNMLSTGSYYVRYRDARYVQSKTFLKV